MNIIPDKKDRDLAIEAILSEGLTQPVSTWKFLLNMRRHLGFRVLFWDTGVAVLAACAVTLCYVLFITQQLSLLRTVIDGWNVYALIFLFSPALFIGLTLCTEALERISGLYDIKMTCKYSIRQITAFRLLCFSLLGTVFTVAVSTVISTVWEFGDLVRMISISLGSLFLCSLLVIHLMRRLRGGWFIGAFAWMVLGLLPLLFFGQAWERLLANFPPAFTTAVAIISFVLFLREIKITARGVCYVDC